MGMPHFTDAFAMMRSVFAVCQFAVVCAAAHSAAAAPLETSMPPRQDGAPREAKKRKTKPGIVDHPGEDMASEMVKAHNVRRRSQKEVWKESIEPVRSSVGRS